MECLKSNECNCSKCYSKLYYINNRLKILNYQKKYYYETSNPKTRRNNKVSFDVGIISKKIIVSFK